MFEAYRREYQIRLPLPLAQLYTRSNGAPDARSSHDYGFSLFETLIKLTTAPLAAAYLEEARAGAVRADQIDQALANLAQPSLGHWVGMLRELSKHFGSRPHADQHPLGHVWKQLTRRYSGQAPLPALYRRIKNGVDGKPAGDKSCTPIELLNSLVQYRNEVSGHGGPRSESFYQEMSELLFNAATELLDEANLDPIGPPGSRLVYINQLRIVDIDRVEVVLQELVGLRGESMPPLRLSKAKADLLLPHRVAVTWPGRDDPLRLDPLLSYSEGNGNPDLLFLNGGYDGAQIKYLSAFTGNVERDQANAQIFAAILTLLRSQPGGNGSAKDEPGAAENASVQATATPSPAVKPSPPPPSGSTGGSSPAPARPAPAPASAPVKASSAPASAVMPPPAARVEPAAAPAPKLAAVATSAAPPTVPPSEPSVAPAGEQAKCPGCGAALPFRITSQFAGEKVRFTCRKCGTSFRLKPPAPREEEMVLLTADTDQPTTASASPAAVPSWISRLRSRLPRLNHPFANEVVSRLSGEYVKLGPFFFLALLVGVTILHKLAASIGGPWLVSYGIDLLTIGTLFLILQLMLQPARALKAGVGAALVTLLGDVIAHSFTGIRLVSRLYVSGVQADRFLLESLGLVPPGLIIALALAISLPALPVMAINLAGLPPQPVPTRLRTLWQRLAQQFPFLNEHWMLYFEEARAGLWGFFLLVCWTMLLYPLWHPTNAPAPAEPGLAEVIMGLAVRWLAVCTGALWIRSRRVLSLWLLPFQQADPAEEALNEIAHLRYETWGALGAIGRAAFAVPTLPPPLEQLRAQHNQAVTEYRALTGQLLDLTSGPDLRRRRRECEAQIHQAQRRMAAIERFAGRQWWETGSTPAELSWASTKLDTLLPQITRAEARLKTSQPPFADTIEASVSVDPQIERRRYIREESLIRAVGLGYLLLSLFLAMSLLASSYVSSASITSSVLVAGMVIFAVPVGLIGMGLCQFKSWARWCALVLASLGLAVVAFALLGSLSSTASAQEAAKSAAEVPASTATETTSSTFHRFLSLGLSIAFINYSILTLLFCMTVVVTMSPRFTRLYTADYRGLVSSTPQVRRGLSPRMRAIFFTAVSLALFLRLAGVVSAYMALPASPSTSSSYDAGSSKS